MERFININGRLCPAPDAAVPYDNRAFRYGHGLFETLLVRDAQIELAHYHWARLFAGMAQLGFRLPGLWSAAVMQSEVQRTVRRNGLEALCRVRLQVWEGNGGLYDPPEPAQFLIECFPLEPHMPQLNEHGLTVGIAEGIYKSCDALSRLKSCNALIYAVAARQARAQRWNDALIRNHHGRIAESAIANIFWVRNGCIFTPPLEEGCVAGVVRQHLLSPEFAKNFPVAEAPLDPAELALADEVFLTNSIRKIKWISSLGGKSFTCTLTAKLSRLLCPAS